VVNRMKANQEMQAGSGMSRTIKTDRHLIVVGTWIIWSSN
jgi:hypothetical protein